MNESKIDFFQLVEDTVQGVITFVDRYLMTIGTLALLPHRFPEKWREQSEGSRTEAFVKPFSTAAISIFLLYLSLAFLLHSGLSNEYPAAFAEIRGEYRDYFAPTRLFLYPIPIIVSLYWLSRFLSKLTAGDYRADVASIALYGCSFQCLALAAYFLSTSALDSIAILFPVYGALVCTLVVWIAMPSGRRWKAVRQLVFATAYSGLSVVLVFVFIVVGFALERFVSPAGPKLAEENRQEELREDVDRVVGQTAHVLKIPEDEVAAMKQKVFDRFYSSKQP